MVVPLAHGRHPNELHFTSPSGGRLNGPNWKRAVHWTANCDGRRVQDLRHTAATLWLTNGVDPKTVQAWLGHSTATLTLDTYSHWIGTDGDATAVARINALLDHPTHPPRPQARPGGDFSLCASKGASDAVRARQDQALSDGRRNLRMTLGGDATGTRGTENVRS
ncbi:tyrosine-type recombinase/integrase [Plantibacter flavus]